MADFLDEVLRDHAEEKKLYYFKKLLPYVIALSLIIVVLMIAYNWYQNSEDEKNMRLGDLLTKIIASDDQSSIRLESLDSIISNNDSRVVELAQFEKVATKIAEEDPGGAKSFLEQIIASKRYYEVTTSYARLIWLNLVIDQERVEGQDKVKFEEYIKHFNDDEQPFFASASLIKSLWYIKCGQPELARDVLGKIISLGSNVPVVIKDQAVSLLSTLK